MKWVAFIFLTLLLMGCEQPKPLLLTDTSRYIDPNDVRELEPTRYTDELSYSTILQTINNVYPFQQNIDLIAGSNLISIDPSYGSSQITIDVNSAAVLEDSNVSDIYVKKSGDTMTGQLINQDSVVVGTGNDTINIGTSNRAIIFGSGGDGNIRTTNAGNDLIIGKSGTNGGNINVSGYDGIVYTGTGSGGFNIADYQWVHGNGINLGDISNRWGNFYPSNSFISDGNYISFGNDEDANIFYADDFLQLKLGRNVDLLMQVNDAGVDYNAFKVYTADPTYGQRQLDLSGNHTLRFPATIRLVPGAISGTNYYLDPYSSGFSSSADWFGSGSISTTFGWHPNWSGTTGVGIGMVFGTGGFTSTGMGLTFTTANNYDLLMSSGGTGGTYIFYGTKGIHFKRSTTEIMSFGDNNITFEAGAVDPSLAWHISGQLGIYNSNLYLDTNTIRNGPDDVNYSCGIPTGGGVVSCTLVV